MTVPQYTSSMTAAFRRNGTIFRPPLSLRAEGQERPTWGAGLTPHAMTAVVGGWFLCAGGRWLSQYIPRNGHSRSLQHKKIPRFRRTRGFSSYFVRPNTPSGYERSVERAQWPNSYQNELPAGASRLSRTPAAGSLLRILPAATLRLKSA